MVMHGDDGYNIFNILEGCTYIHIELICRRSEDKVLIASLFSLESRNKCRRTNSLSYLSWGLEFLGRLFIMTQFIGNDDNIYGLYNGISLFYATLRTCRIASILL